MVSVNPSRLFNIQFSAVRMNFSKLIYKRLIPLKTSIIHTILLFSLFEFFLCDAVNFLHSFSVRRYYLS